MDHQDGMPEAWRHYTLSGSSGICRSLLMITSAGRRIYQYSKRVDRPFLANS